MRSKVRKQRPQPPPWFWYEVDGCWFCKKQGNCGGCKVLKSYVKAQKEKKRKSQKNMERWQSG